MLVAAVYPRCSINAFVSRITRHEQSVRFSQFRVHRSGASLADPA